MFFLFGFCLISSGASGTAFRWQDIIRCLWWAVHWRNKENIQKKGWQINLIERERGPEVILFFVNCYVLIWWIKWIKSKDKWKRGELNSQTSVHLILPRANCAGGFGRTVAARLFFLIWLHGGSHVGFFCLATWWGPNSPIIYGSYLLLFALLQKLSRHESVWLLFLIFKQTGTAAWRTLCHIQVPCHQLRA